MVKNKLSESQISDVVPIVSGILKNHVGKDNAISSYEIIYYLEDVHRILVKPAQFRAIIHYIRVNHVLDGVLANGVGYFVSKNSDEKKAYLEKLGSRIDAITEVYDALQVN